MKWARKIIVTMFASAWLIFSLVRRQVEIYSFHNTLSSWWKEWAVPFIETLDSLPYVVWVVLGVVVLVLTWIPDWIRRRIVRRIFHQWPAIRQLVPDGQPESEDITLTYSSPVANTLLNRLHEVPDAEEDFERWLEKTGVAVKAAIDGNARRQFLEIVRKSSSKDKRTCATVYIRGLAATIEQNHSQESRRASVPQRKTPKLEFVDEIERGSPDSPEMLYRVGVVHDGPETVHNTFVEIAHLIPLDNTSQSHIEMCRQKHNVRLWDKHYKKDEVDLHEGRTPHWFDCVVKDSTSDVVCLRHKVHKRHLQCLPDGDYLLVLSARGQNCTSAEKTFRFYVEGLGALRFGLLTRICG